MLRTVLKYTAGNEQKPHLRSLSLGLRHWDWSSRLTQSWVCQKTFHKTSASWFLYPRSWNSRGACDELRLYNFSFKTEITQRLSKCLSGPTVCSLHFIDFNGFSKSWVLKFYSEGTSIASTDQFPLISPFQNHAMRKGALLAELGSRGQSSYSSRTDE